MNGLHPQIHQSLRLARTYLDRHYDRPITIKQVSQEAALSPYHFIRMFQRVYKQTPHQYVIQRRIEKAKTLLRSSDLSITDICAAVGFESLGSFSALFRRETGLSPSTYRACAAPDQRPTQIPLCTCLLYGINYNAEK
jgi:AraC-like DNA-binding protein